MQIINLSGICLNWVLLPVAVAGNEDWPTVLADGPLPTVRLGKAKLCTVLKYPGFAETLCVLRSKGSSNSNSN